MLGIVRFFLRPLAIPFACTLVVGCRAPVARRATLPELARQYRSTANEIQKRDICLRAIEFDYVKRGGSLDAVRQLCGSDFHELGKDPKDPDWDHGVADFAPVPPPRYIHGMIASLVPEGWYLIVQYSGDVIRDYYISNVHSFPEVQTETERLESERNPQFR